MTNNLQFDTTKSFFKPFFCKYIKDNQKYIKSCIDELNLDNLYENANTYSDTNGVFVTSRLTRLLYNIGIDPLDYLTEVPAYFMNYVQARIDLILPENITAIGDFAFASSWIKSITIPNTCTYFGDRIFYDCKKLDYVYYNGTYDEFKKISKERKWRADIDSSSPVWVKCVDGRYDIHDV